MTTLFGRRVVVTVDTLQVEDLRVQFQVKKTLLPEPNTLNLRITNLAEKTRALMKKKGAKVLVEAGYQGSTSQIFAGDARTIDHIHEGSDWVTHVQCGDGESSFGYDTHSASYKPGTKVKDIAMAVAKSMRVSPGNIVKAFAAGGLKVDEMVNGYAAHGKASAVMTRLMRAAGLEWSIQDGAIQVLKPDSARDATAFVLSSDTGLIGSPDHGTPDKKGGPTVLKVRSLLQGQIRPGSRLELQAKELRGSYRAETVEHVGDTAGGDWFTNIEARPL